MVLAWFKNAAKMERIRQPSQAPSALKGRFFFSAGWYRGINSFSTTPSTLDFHVHVVAKMKLHSFALLSTLLGSALASTNSSEGLLKADGGRSTPREPG